MQNDLNPLTEPSSKRNGANIVFLSMAGLYIFVCLCMGLVVFLATGQTTALRNYITTETPDAMMLVEITPTPTLIVHEPVAGDQVIKGDFSDNERNWNSKWSDGTLAIKDGKMTLASSAKGKIAMSQCNKCPYLHNKFYMEADFSTDREINEDYGIGFNIRNDYQTGYFFEINAVKQTYKLYERDRTSSSYETWRLRLSNHTSLIKSYPAVNKLAVGFDKDVIDLYINENLVEHYQDTGTDLTFGEFSFYVDDSGFDLIVDNLFAYGQ